MGDARRENVYAVEGSKGDNFKIKWIKKDTAARMPSTRGRNVICQTDARGGCSVQLRSSCNKITNIKYAINDTFDFIAEALPLGRALVKGGIEEEVAFANFRGLSPGKE